MSSDWSQEQVSFLCRHCGTHSLGGVVATEYWTEPLEDEEGVTFAGPDYRYRLVRCAACRDLSLLIAMQIGSEPDAFDDESGHLRSAVYEADYSVYPALPRSLSAAIPKSLQSCFQEARACYQARAYTASAIMCRRALELLANERGVKERNLAQALAALKDQGDIDQRLYDWCDALRLAGNQAAHDVAQGASQVDAKDMNDLAEAIIDYVYVFQARYEEFRRRRGRAS